MLKYILYRQLILGNIVIVFANQMKKLNQLEQDLDVSYYANTSVCITK